jgi:HD-like signal output (HDOD) protein
MLQVDENVLKDIGRGFTVPAQPHLLLELQRLVGEDNPDLNRIAEAVSQDVSISATIIKTINSPLYGLARSISDIPKSVRYIGINGIVTLVTSKLIQSSFEQSKCSIELDDFWDNATNIANTAVYIAKKLRKRVPSEKLFSLGLFHDCGIPVMAMKYKDYGDILQTANQTPSKTLINFEDQAYSVNHATIGYYVATSWRLPVDMCQLILRHHDIEYLNKLDGSSDQLCFAILKMAEQIIYQHKYFRDSSDWEYVRDSVFTVLDCDEELMQDIVEDIEEQL